MWLTLRVFISPFGLKGVGEGVIFQPQIREGMHVIFLVVKGLGTRRQYAMIVTRIWALFDICEVRHT